MAKTAPAPERDARGPGGETGRDLPGGLWQAPARVLASCGAARVLAVDQMAVMATARTRRRVEVAMRQFMASTYARRRGE